MPGITNPLDAAAAILDLANTPLIPTAGTVQERFERTRWACLSSGEQTLMGIAGELWTGAEGRNVAGLFRLDRHLRRQVLDVLCELSEAL